MTEQTKFLRHAVRPTAVGHYLGKLLIAFGAASAVPAAVAFATSSPALAGSCATAAAGAAVVGYLLQRLPEPSDLQRNEGLVIVAAIFVVGAAAMTWPFTTVGLSPTDAFFESVSAITTTGLTMVAEPERASFGFLFLRSYMQWYGGLGIVALALALTPASGAIARRLSSAAGPGREDELVASTRSRLRRVLLVYLGLTATAWVLSVLGGGGAGDSLHHALCAVSTGGFSSFDDSLAGYGSGLLTAFTLGIATASAISFSLYIRAKQEGPGVLLRDFTVRALFAGAFAFAAALFFALWYDGRDPAGAAADGLALAFSAHTSAGFSTTSVEALPDTGKLLLIGAMFVGGDLGSTAGGFKIVRALVIVRLLAFSLSRLGVPPHAVVRPTLHGRPLSRQETDATFQLFAWFLALETLSWLAFIVAGYAPLDALFDVVSATGTVGLSTGVTDSDLAAPLKLVLSADMLLGRVEILALLALVDPRSWLGRRREP